MGSVSPLLWAAAQKYSPKALRNNSLVLVGDVVSLLSKEI